MLRIQVTVESSDLLILISQVDDKEKLRLTCTNYVKHIRDTITDHIRLRPEFESSLEPLLDVSESQLVRRMYEASALAGVGPMATVAGLTSELLGAHLLAMYPDATLYIENGGDNYIHSSEPVKVGIYAGDSPLSNKLSLVLQPESLPMGVCTSAGTIGHSLSFGKADAVVVLSKDTVLADAVATATCNRVTSATDIREALDFAMAIDGIVGVVIIIGDHFGALGDIQLS